MAPARLLSLLPLLTPALAQYSQQARWQGSNFFDGFDFFTASDPTHGFVNYVDQGTAQRNGLISTTGNTAYMGVDYTSVLAADGSQGGRQSVRLTSKTAYTTGLFILDVQHMPGGICGVWPSWWTVGQNWPNNGEIDIIEGVNDGNTNLMSLHTSNGCTAPGSGETGQVVTGDCYQYDPNQSNSGCGVKDPDTNSYGNGFNAIGGGVYAMEWTNSAIKVWFFPRGAIPGDINSGAPNPAGWGTPQGNFGGSSCNVPSHFNSHNVVFDTTFCGDWAGSVFGSDGACAPKGSCQSYVAGSPGDFKNAYWEINYMAVYSVPANAAAAVVENIKEPVPTSTMTPIASTSPAAASSVANNAAGASGQAVPGVTPVPKVAPAMLNQQPATQNRTDDARAFGAAKRGALLFA